MRNLIKSEFYKLKRVRAFKVMVGLTLLLSISMVFFAVFAGDIFRANGLGGLLTGSMHYSLGLGNSVLMIFFGSILAGIFICNDFENRSIQEAISAGWSRRSVILSKMIVYFIAMIGVLLLYPVITCVSLSLIFGFGIPVTSEVLLPMLGMLVSMIAIYAATLSIAVFISFVSRKSSTAIICCLGVLLMVIPILMGFGSNIPVLQDILPLTPFALHDLVLSYEAGFAEFGKAILASFICIEVLFLATFAVFRRSELK